MAAAPMMEAVANTPELAGEVVVIRDLMNIGPIKKTEDVEKFSTLRTAFWQMVVPGEKNAIQVDDTERVLEVSAHMAANSELVAWLWVAPWPADICTWLWLTKYLGKYPGRFFVINIAGLPFLDENGKLFYPKNISELKPKEIVKARKLARAVTYAEIETDGEEWRKLTEENASIRTLDGGKKITSRKDDHYDAHLMSFVTEQNQKVSKIVHQAITKFNIPTGDLFLGWRMRQLAGVDKVRIQGDITKTLKDLDCKLPGAVLDFGEQAS